MQGKSMKQAHRRWGIVVGVDTYEHADENLHNLQGCLTDARRFYDIMTDEECCGFRSENVLLLENPRFGDLENAFMDIGSNLKKGDELWFYFAGHGYSDSRKRRDNGYLLLSDASYDSRKGFLRSAGSMSKSQLHDMVADSVSVGDATIVFFLDCCCAASVGLNDGSRGVAAASQLNSIAETFRNFAPIRQDDGGGEVRFMSFMATDKYGRAREDECGGSFTTRLLEGLRGGTPDFPTTPGNGIYVTAGSLGVYLGANTPSQCPKQDVSDPMYPLSVSPRKKREHERNSAIDRKVCSWLAGLDCDLDDKQFAERVVAGKERFEHAAALRTVLRLMSEAESSMAFDGGSAAGVLAAFHELADPRGGSRPPAARPVPEPEPRRRPAGTCQQPLSRQDRELLVDVAARFRKAGENGIDIAEFGAMTQSEAASALYARARERMRNAWKKAWSGGCGACPPLYTAEERAKWYKKSTKGFASQFERAVYEFVSDDKALSPDAGGGRVR